jgi:hypothetical protein
MKKRNSEFLRLSSAIIECCCLLGDLGSGLGGLGLWKSTINCFGPSK